MIRKLTAAFAAAALALTVNAVALPEENTIEFSAGNDAVYTFFWFPHAKTLRQRSGFRKVMEQRGFLALWRERGWPDLCHPVGESFECD